MDGSSSFNFSGTFEDFWAIYPKKVARKDAMKAWSRLTSSDQVTALKALPLHVEHWAVSDTEWGFIPYPASWLNGQRFHDVLVPPKPRGAAPDWMKTEAGIISEGKRRGLEPKRGENFWDFRRRVEAA